MTDTLHAYHRDQILMANSAIGGLLSLQEKLQAETGYEAMPEWFSDFHRESLHSAIGACSEQIARSIEWLTDNAPEREL